MCAGAFASMDEDEPRVEEEDVVTSHFWTGFVYAPHNTFLQKSSSCKSGCVFCANHAEMATLSCKQERKKKKKRTQSHKYRAVSSAATRRRRRSEGRRRKQSLLRRCAQEIFMWLLPLRHQRRCSVLVWHCSNSSPWDFTLWFHRTCVGVQLGDINRSMGSAGMQPHRLLCAHGESSSRNTDALAQVCGAPNPTSSVLLQLESHGFWLFPPN